MAPSKDRPHMQYSSGAIAGAGADGGESAFSLLFASEAATAEEDDVDDDEHPLLALTRSLRALAQPGQYHLPGGYKQHAYTR